MHNVIEIMQMHATLPGRKQPEIYKQAGDLMAPVLMRWGTASQFFR